MLNQARAELGLEPVDSGAQARNTEHFDREASRRQQARDRAIQINEGWQNRAAIDRQTRAINKLSRDSAYGRPSLYFRKGYIQDMDPRY